MTSLAQTAVKFAASAFLALFATAIIARSIGHSTEVANPVQSASYAHRISQDAWLDVAAVGALRLNA